MQRHDSFTLLILVCAASVLAAPFYLSAARERYLDATEHFSPPPADSPVAYVPFYIEQPRHAPHDKGVAIDTVQYQGSWSAAETVFDGPVGRYNASLNAIAEEDGQSSYILYLNEEQQGSRHNPPTAENRMAVEHAWNGLDLKPGDRIRIAFRGASNGLVPEGGGYAWARGRWQGLVLKPVEPGQEVTPPSDISAEAVEVGLYGFFEGTIENLRPYQDRFRDVSLDTVFTRPDGSEIRFYGFHDGDTIWRFRCLADQLGQWRYRAVFDDGSGRSSGVFNVVPHKRKGILKPLTQNPAFWTDLTGSAIILRSFHVGDRFFAANWPKQDRKAFLDWAQSEGYNTLSIASFFLNRDVSDRGEDWETPDLWDEATGDPDPVAFQKAEAILDILESKGFYVFPFAGFLGRSSDFARNSEDQQVYLQYTLARFAPYWNLLMNVAGPEPLLPVEPYLSVEAIDRVGNYLQQQNPFAHPLTVHNPTLRNPWKYHAWQTFSTLQGPKATDLLTLNTKTERLINPNLPAYAQESLWVGNSLHPDFQAYHVKQNTIAFLFSGVQVNFGDMDGNSSSGFSGNLNPENANAAAHAAIHEAWDFVQTLPLTDLRPWRHAPYPAMYADRLQYHLLPGGYEGHPVCPEPGNQEPHQYRLNWISMDDLWHRIDGGTVNCRDGFVAPAGDHTWIAELVDMRNNPEKVGDPLLIAKGNYPDMVIGANGLLHIVYTREKGLYYRTCNPASGELGEEEDTGLRYEGSNWDGPQRGDPEIVLDNENRPHVLVGAQYARKTIDGWIHMDPGVQRDHALAIDPEGNLMAVKRGGNNGGHVGAQFLRKAYEQWEPTVTDPDIGTEHGTDWRGPGDHPYGHVTASASGRFYVVYRQGEPDYIAYRWTDDLGETWHGGGVFSGNTWQTESPSGIVDDKGAYWVIGGNGNLFRKDSDHTTFRWIARPLHAGSRTYPSMAFDASGNLYIAAYGGMYNVLYPDGSLAGHQRLRGGSYQKNGYVELVTVPGHDYVYAIFEQGDQLSNKKLSVEGTILLSTLGPEGETGF